MSSVMLEKFLKFSRRNLRPPYRESRNLLKDFLVYSAVMAVCTLIGLLFRRFAESLFMTAAVPGQDRSPVPDSPRAQLLYLLIC